MFFDKYHDGKDSEEGEDYTPSVTDSNVRGLLQSSISNLFNFFSKTKQDHKEGTLQNDTPTVATSTTDARLGDGRKSRYTSSKGKQNVHTGTSSSLAQGHGNLDSASVTHIGEEVSPSCLGTWYSVVPLHSRFFTFITYVWLIHLF